MPNPIIFIGKAAEDPTLVLRGVGVELRYSGQGNQPLKKPDAPETWVLHLLVRHCKVSNLSGFGEARIPTLSVSGVGSVNHSRLNLLESTHHNY